MSDGEMARPGRGDTEPEDAGRPPPEDGATCAYGHILCEGREAKTCDGRGGYTETTSCSAECKDGLGCVDCVPNAGTCDVSLSLAKVCNATGTTEVSFSCSGPGVSCEADGCHGPCSPSELGFGYQGCEFWPTVTANPVFSDRMPVTPGGGFRFGIILGNVSDTRTASVKITRSPAYELSLEIKPGDTSIVPLPWVFDLKGQDWDAVYMPPSTTQSVLSAIGAYHVLSNTPLVAYQFSSLEPELADPPTCPSLPTGAWGCFPVSSDASLLLPSHALGSSYVVAGQRSWHEDAFLTPFGATRMNMGDFVAITATQPNTEVSVTLRPGQTLLPWLDGQRVKAGETVRLTMNAGQVLQLFSPGATDDDTLSGASITSTREDKPIQILSGVGCASVPENPRVCGHVEDLVLPLDALGKDYVVPSLFLASGMPQPTATKAAPPLPSTLRIQAISKDTALAFEPPTINPVILGPGDVLEIPDVKVDMRISSSTPFAVTQLLQARSKTSPDPSVGGPTQVPAISIAQFRSSYSFVISPAHALHLVAVIAPTGTPVELDGVPIPPESFGAVGTSGMSVARQVVTREVVTRAGAGRVHKLTAGKPVGLVVHGFSAYASYAYPAGLDWKRGAALSSPR